MLPYVGGPICEYVYVCVTLTVHIAKQEQVIAMTGDDDDQATTMHQFIITRQNVLSQL